MKVELLPAFDDNYLFVLHKDGKAAVVDPGDASVIKGFLDKHQLQLTDILLTHHHWDHVGGVNELVGAYKPQVWGAASDLKRLPAVTNALQPGDDASVLGHSFKVYDVSGHTIGHIAYYFEQEHIAFVGDTLFNHGCGRMFEGSPEQFWHSLRTIRDELAADTWLYCAHEYTLANLRFALSIEPNNSALQKVAEKCEQLRAKGEKTVPMLLSEQVRTNPFLRCDERNMMDLLAADDAVSAFAKLRKAKDNF